MCIFGHISHNVLSVHGHESFKVSSNTLYVDDFTDILL